MPEPLIISPYNISRIVSAGGYWTRRDIADALGRGKTTFLIETCERAVRMGLINKIAGYDAQGRETWLYTIEVSQLGILPA